MGRRRTIPLRLLGFAMPVPRRRNLALAVMRVLPVGIDLQQLRRDARDGLVSVEQLLDLIDKQQQTIQGVRRDNCTFRDFLTVPTP